jgi:hypothetical protein
MRSHEQAILPPQQPSDSGAAIEDDLGGVRLLGAGVGEWVQRIAARGIIQGYQCGGPFEPCSPEERPYFRPNNHVTRGQTAKIVHLAMLEPTLTPTQTIASVPTSTVTATPTQTVEPAASPTATPTSTPTP